MKKREIMSCLDDVLAEYVRLPRWNPYGKKFKELSYLNFGYSEVERVLSEAPEEAEIPDMIEIVYGFINQMDRFIRMRKRSEAALAFACERDAAENILDILLALEEV